MRATLTASPERTWIVGLVVVSLVIAVWNYVEGYYGAVMVTAIGAFLAVSILVLADL